MTDDTLPASLKLHLPDAAATEACGAAIAPTVSGGMVITLRGDLGSGIAEAACKRVVSTRFKQTGMRWTPDGLDAILPLRTAKLNRSFDQFWQTQSQLVA